MIDADCGVATWVEDEGDFRVVLLLFQINVHSLEAGAEDNLLNERLESGLVDLDLVIHVLTDILDLDSAVVVCRVVADGHVVFQQ